MTMCSMRGYVWQATERRLSGSHAAWLNDGVRMETSGASRRASRRLASPFGRGPAAVGHAVDAIGTHSREDAVCGRRSAPRLVQLYTRADEHLRQDIRRWVRRVARARPARDASSTRVRDAIMRRFYRRSAWSPASRAAVVWFRRAVLRRKPVLYHFEVHITDHCNLNCKGCAHFSNLCKPTFADLDEFEADMSAHGGPLLGREADLPARRGAAAAPAGRRVRPRRARSASRRRAST